MAGRQRTTTAAKRKIPARRRKPAPRRRPATAPAASSRPSRRDKLLVTGAAGALAQHLIAELAGDYEVIGVDFRGTRATHPDTVDYEVDFNKRTFEDVFREHDFGAILHLGRIRASQLDRGRRYSENVIGTDRMLRLAVKYGVEQVLVLSTYHVYGAHPSNPSLIDEDYPLMAAGRHGELVDAVELENLANIYLYKNPELHVTVLRPCNIVGPGINNAIGKLLSQPVAPCLGGFSPLMQFIHVEDMAAAIVTAYRKNVPGVYNVAPDDWIAFQDALELAGCRRLPLPSIPPMIPRILAGALGRYTFPTYLVDFFKYPVVLDGGKFARTFGFAPRYGYGEIFAYYRSHKGRARL